MSLNEVVKLLNIPHSTFNDWSQKEHSKYELSLLIKGLDLDEVKSIIEKEKNKFVPKYRESTRQVVLHKSWFSIDLFWTSADKIKVDIQNIISVYMNRANQIDTDKLCQLFGFDRVLKVTQKLISNDMNRYEALRQIEYSKSKLYNLPFDFKNELENDFLKNPSQRVIDYLCQTKGFEDISHKVEISKLSLHKKLILKKMLAYYKKGTDDTTIKRSA